MAFYETFAVLLRHTLASADASALAQWLQGQRMPPAVISEHGLFDPADALVQADAAAARGILSQQSIDALHSTALSIAQWRAAEGMALAVLGRRALAHDSRLQAASVAAPAFAEDATISVFEFLPAALVVLRSIPNGRAVLCMTNASDVEQLVPVPWRKVLGSANVRDLVGGARLAVHGPSFALPGHDVRWLQA